MISAEVEEKELLSLAASLEKSSEHPLAAAIVEGAENRGATFLEVRDFDSHTGKGVSGTINGKAVLLGNLKLMEDFAVNVTSLAAEVEEMSKEAQTVMFIGVDGRFGGIVAVADPIKESTPEAVKKLHAEGLRVVMLTGDNKATAQAVAAKLDIDEVVAEVLPDQKAAVVKKFQDEGRMVAMAGDGRGFVPFLWYHSESYYCGNGHEPFLGFGGN